MRGHIRKCHAFVKISISHRKTATDPREKKKNVFFHSLLGLYVFNVALIVINKYPYNTNFF